MGELEIVREMEPLFLLFLGNKNFFFAFCFLSLFVFCENGSKTARDGVVCGEKRTINTRL